MINSVATCYITSSRKRCKEKVQCDSEDSGTEEDEMKVDNNQVNI